MTPEAMSLVAGLLGAVIGAAASIVTVLVQARIQDRRDRARQCVELALEDYKLQLQIADKLGLKGGMIPPVTLYVDYHIRLAKLIESSSLTPDSYAKVVAENQALLRKIEELNARPSHAAS